jgi:hypothetical protein
LHRHGAAQAARSASEQRVLGAAKHFDFRLDVLNLFDSKDDDITYWYASRLPGEPAAGVDDYHFHPIEPRDVRAYFTWKF